MEKQKRVSKSQETILSTLTYKLLEYQEEKIEQGRIWNSAKEKKHITQNDSGHHKWSTPKYNEKHL